MVEDMFLEMSRSCESWCSYIPSPIPFFLWNSYQSLSSCLLVWLFCSKWMSAHPSTVPIWVEHPRIIEATPVSDCIPGCPVLVPAGVWHQKLPVLEGHALMWVTWRLQEHSSQRCAFQFSSVRCWRVCDSWNLSSVSFREWQMETLPISSCPHTEKKWGQMNSQRYTKQSLCSQLFKGPSKCTITLYGHLQMAQGGGLSLPFPTAIRTAVRPPQG